MAAHLLIVESTHALALATSQFLFKMVSASGLFAHLITLQQSKHLDLRLLVRERKRMEAGSLGFLQLKISYILKKNLNSMYFIS
jgi:hypothetical protein